MLGEVRPEIFRGRSSQHDVFIVDWHDYYDVIMTLNGDSYSLMYMHECIVRLHK